MCKVCGCGEATTEIHHHSHDHDHDHDHHDHSHTHTQNIDFAANDAGCSVPGISTARTIEIEKNILSKNDHYALLNRKRFQQDAINVSNWVSSPGSGKTALLTALIKHLGAENIAVIEGDQQTSNDAERIRATGAQAIQINTGKGCHLDAHMVGHAYDNIHLHKQGLLFIENVGNLVCPAGFDLGESSTVVILSVTEGEDKPLKYQQIFRSANLMVINKIDLLPYVDFSVETCIEYAKRINPELQIIQVSATKSIGLDGLAKQLQLKAIAEKPVHA